MSVQEAGSPSQTDLNLNVKLIKDNNLVFEKVYSIDRRQPFINLQSRDVDKLRSDFVNNMVESLSLSTKECIQRIVKDINQVIKKPEGPGRDNHQRFLESFDRILLPESKDFR
jgi:hypothetical protein